MSPDKRLEKIINDGLCIGCGLCTAIAGEAAFGQEAIGCNSSDPSSYYAVAFGGTCSRATSRSVIWPLPPVRCGTASLDNKPGQRCSTSSSMARTRAITALCGSSAGASGGAAASGCCRRGRT